MKEWIVSQIGRREHYAVPRALHRSGVLRRFYTDLWCRYGHSIFRRLPGRLRFFASHYHPELPSSRVRGFTGWAMTKKLSHWLSSDTSDENRYQHFIDVGRGFARRVQEDLYDSDLDPDQSVFFGYDTGSLEILENLQDTDCCTILDHVDPGQTEKEIVLEEADNWPDWADEVPVLHDPYQERRAAERELASAIVVNSEWSKQCFLEQGVPDEKLEVVPLAYEPNVYQNHTRGISPARELRVLWLGSVILRKGIQYLIAAARQLKTAPITLDVVGPIGITEEAVASAPENVNFHGPVPGDKVSNYYKSADLFVLPTLSDGFAITQLEAMAHGLPVIATPNCGRVVTDGVDGRIVPPRNAEALADTIASFVDDQSRLQRMSEGALSTVQDYTLERCADRLLSIVDGNGA